MEWFARFASLGPVLGWLIVAGYVLAVLNNPVKWIHKRWVSKRPAASRFRKAYAAVMKVVVRYHRWFAMLATTAMILHFLIQFSQYGLYVSGIVTGGLMLAQGSLGAYGTYVRQKRRTAWFYVHRTVAILLVPAMAFHIFVGRI